MNESQDPKPESNEPATSAKPVLGSARGTFELKPGWDDPLTDAEMADIFGL